MGCGQILVLWQWDVASSTKGLTCCSNKGTRNENRNYVWKHFVKWPHSSILLNMYRTQNISSESCRSWKRSKAYEAYMFRSSDHVEKSIRFCMGLNRRYIGLMRTNMKCTRQFSAKTHTTKFHWNPSNSVRDRISGRTSLLCANIAYQTRVFTIVAYLNWQRPPSRFFLGSQNKLL
jgi:hypothetical protein